VGVAGALTASFAYGQQLGLNTNVVIGASAIEKTADPVVKAAKIMTQIPINNDTSFVSLVSSKEIMGAPRVSNALKPLNLFKGTAAANAALAGATVITVAFAVIQSVAIDQFIAIQTARPKLEAALAQAQQPVNLNQLLTQPNGADLALYYWAKAMEAEFVIEDPQLVALAAAAHQRAQSAGYRLAVAQ
jgi:hypothetical protein